jgi:tetratricopeptide (TPR) repeat protein
VAFAKGALARVLLSAGQSRDALEMLEPVIAEIRQIGERHLLALGLLNLGWARLGVGQVADAITALNEALHLTASLGNRVDTARVLEAMAAAAVAAGEAERGALLYGAAEGVRRAIGAEVWLNDRVSSERVGAGLRAAMSAAKFEERFADGIKLSVLEALAGAREL